MDKLFIIPYNQLEFNNDYKWSKVKEFFDNLIDKSIETDDISKFYYMLIHLIYYINFSIYNNKLNIELNQYINYILNKKEIITLCIKNNNYDLLHPFLKGFIINNNKYENYDKYIKLINRIDDINNIKNTSYKKILNTIIYRDLYSKNIGFNSFHDFYFKNIEPTLNINSFIKRIPSYLDIINIKYKNTNSHYLKLHKIINTIFDIQKYIISTNDNNITVTYRKTGGKIIFISDKINDIIQTQFDLDILLHNNKQIKEKYMKNNINIIYIKYNSTEFKDDFPLLDLIHRIISAKTKLLLFPQNLSELIYFTDTTYLQEVFNYFIKLTKNKNFVLQIFKFLYIYAYYDYFFYYNTKLVSTLTNNEHKSTIFIEFCDHTHNIFKFPIGMNKFPPFYDNDTIIGYEFQYPNYIKLYYLVNAIYSKHNNDIQKALYHYLGMNPSSKKSNDIIHQVIPEDEVVNYDDTSESSNENSNLNGNIYQELQNDDQKFIFNTIENN